MRFLACAGVAALAGCASDQGGREVTAPRPAEVRAQIAALLPSSATDRPGWAVDIYAALVAQNIEPSTGNICAVLAVTEQESGFRADPPVPNLGRIAWEEIDRRAERIGVPKLAVHLALQIGSPNGKSYSDRIDAAKTEQDLSRIFDDMIGAVPMGQRLFAGLNPVHTGGPMQVGIAFAERQAKSRGYPYPLKGSIRDEVFTRRGGMYFGIAHLLDYPAAYESPLYRFADYNAGRHASRNAAFQNAVSLASGIPLALDGDLIRHDKGDDGTPGSTELAVRALARKLDLSDAEIRRALEQGDGVEFERSALYRRVFDLADRLEGKPLPRAVLPKIALESPKITRKLTTEWFANRVNDRYRRCLDKAAGAGVRKGPT